MSPFSLRMSKKVHLERSYFDPKSPISYAGPTKVRVYKHLKKEGKYKVSLRAIRKWLRDVDANSLQCPQRFKFKTRRDIYKALMHYGMMIWSMLDNGGTKYLLVVIDVFSSYLWIEHLKNKPH